MRSRRCVRAPCRKTYVVQGGIGRIGRACLARSLAASASLSLSRWLCRLTSFPSLPYVSVSPALALSLSLSRPNRTATSAPTTVGVRGDNVGLIALFSLSLSRSELTQCPELLRRRSDFLDVSCKKCASLDLRSRLLWIVGIRDASRPRARSRERSGS